MYFRVEFNHSALDWKQKMKHYKTLLYVKESSHLLYFVILELDAQTFERNAL